MCAPPEDAAVPESPATLDDAAVAELDDAAVAALDDAAVAELDDAAVAALDDAAVAALDDAAVAALDDAAVAAMPEAVRLAEALLFASDRPVTEARLQSVLPDGQVAATVLAALGAALEGRGVVLAAVAGGWVLRTAPDLAPALTRVVEVPRRLPRVAMETLAVIAWHQPVTRAEIEEIRGAGLSQATLEALLENGLVAPKGHKEVPGRPALWGTTPRFLEQFGLGSLRDLPRREELVSAEVSAPLLELAQEAVETGGQGGQAQ